MFVSIGEYVHVCKYSQKTEEGIGFSETGLQGGCEPPDTGTGDPALASGMGVSI